MTRDEAIEKFHRVTYPESIAPGGMPSPQKFMADRQWSAKAIDGFVALGMLVLEEPKSVDERLAEALMSSFTFDTEEREMQIFRDALDKAGLMLIAKK